MHTLVLGFDALDPGTFERLSGEGRLPNLTRHAEAGGYARLEIANPAQTEVSWTSIATGLNPGGHGIFDFVHRDPATYTPYMSLLPTRRGIAGTQFRPPFNAQTIFDQAAKLGFPATAMWWPATFPSRPESPVRMIPGLGTPDIQGRIGVGTLLSTNAELSSAEHKTSFELLSSHGKARFAGLLRGPVAKKRRGSAESTVELQLDLVGDDAARLHIGKNSIELRAGEWSPIVDLSFKVGRLLSVRALTRVILTRVRPDIKLYVLPLQIHPLHSLWRYGSPQSFLKQAWKAAGAFLTLGWPQDTTALEEGHISAGQFLDLCESICDARERILMDQLPHFGEGLLACVFDSLDRVQHMFWRDRQDIVGAWYEKMDGLVGRVEQRLTELGQGAVKVIILSDHGFTDYAYKVHLNRWFVEKGYLSTHGEGVSGTLKDVDWSRSQAYAVGLNSAYLNLQGREGQAAVATDDYGPLVEKLRSDMLDWEGPDGRPVVQQVWRQDEAFQGPLQAHGPDMVVGYTPGYRASGETGLGQWKEASVELNRDRWGGDHCVAPQAVPGVLFSNQGLANYPRPSYHDMPMIAIGTNPDAGDLAPPPSLSGEDEEIVQERLRGLGYL